MRFLMKKRLPRTGRLRLARRASRLALLALAGLVGLWAALILAYRFVDPPLTPLMLLRLPAAGTIEHRSRPLARIAPALALAVIAAEDNRFCLHYGIDWHAVGEAIDEFQDGGRLRGASTISMQVARNLFLWPGGGLPRKLVESGLALAIELAWPKRRILEVYLNVAEWGDGIYGAEAAARAHFGKGANALSIGEAGLLAAVLPSPLRWSASRPGEHVRARAARINARAERLGGYLGCLD